MEEDHSFASDDDDDDQNHSKCTFTRFRALPQEIIGSVLALLPIREVVRLKELSTESRDKYLKWAMCQVTTVTFDVRMEAHMQWEVCGLLARHARSSLRELFLHDYGSLTKTVRTDSQCIREAFFVWFPSTHGRQNERAGGR